MALWLEMKAVGTDMKTQAIKESLQM